MGKLVEDMTRLVGEIEALHGSRLAFVENLKQTVGEQRRENRDENAARHRACAEQQREMRAEMAAAGRAWAGHGQQPQRRAEFAPARAPARRARAGRGA